MVYKMKKVIYNGTLYTRGVVLIGEDIEDFKLEETTIWSFPDRGNGQRIQGDIGGTGLLMFREILSVDIRKKMTGYWISSWVAVRH